jgi:DnaJ-domain-containing protein 1
MSDDFALLDEPRRPWVDPEQLKSKFLRLSTAVHPDHFQAAAKEEKRAHNQRFADLNAAYNRLREPRARLRYLLELELGAKPKDVQRIPPGTMDLFQEVGQLCRDADTFLAGKANTTSPMLKVRLFEQGLEWTDKLNALQRKINAKRETLDDELKTFNATWESAPAVGSSARVPALPLERLEQVYRVFSYIARWTEQIQERVVQLSF